MTKHTNTAKQIKRAFVNPRTTENAAVFHFNGGGLGGNDGIGAATRVRHNGQVGLFFIQVSIQFVWKRWLQGDTVKARCGCSPRKQIAHSSLNA